MPPPLHPLLRTARRWIRRHRRPLAATLAAVAMLAAIGTLRPEPSPEAQPDPEPELTSGRVAIAIDLGPGGRMLQPGDVVDLYAVPEAQPARIVATGVEVLRTSAESGALAPPNGDLVLAAVSVDDALDVAAAQAQGEIGAMLQAP